MEASDKKNWLFGIIALLLLALVIEIGFLISKATFKSEGTKQNLQPIQHYRYSTRQPVRSPLSPDDWNNWDPFQEMQNMQKAMNRIFDESFGRGIRSRPSEFSFAPAIDLRETKDAYIAKADLPGLDKDKIDISVSGNVLAVRGERKVESEKEDTQQGIYSSERSYGSFSRSVDLPGPVDESRVSADYKNGVLTVTLPKLKGSEKAEKKVTIG